MTSSVNSSPLPVSLNMDRFGLDSQWQSPASGAWTPSSTCNTADQSMIGSRAPLAPSICLEHIWTELGKGPRYDFNL